MRLQETVLCSAGASSSSQGLGTVSLHDFQTGALLASFKQTCADTHATAVQKTGNGQGGFILTAQPDKSILNAYHFQKDQIAMKMVLPEKLSCIAMDSTGDYLAGGTSQGRIYLWEIASGILFNVWDAHYRKVTVLRFTRDGLALISGSEDSGVSVWLLSSLLSNDSRHDIPVPYCTLSDHTLPITDIICGVGLFPSCRVLTSSLDHSVKLWDLSSRSLLTTFILPFPIGMLALESAERTFFAASSGKDGSDNASTGIVYELKLFRHREAQETRGFEALGGGGVSEAIRLDADSKGIINVGQAISSMTLSLTQSALLVGTRAGEVRLYDIVSHQLLRTFSAVKDKSQGLAVTHIECILKPPDLIGHLSLDLHVNGVTMAKDIMPTKPIAPFQKVRDEKARDAHEVQTMLRSFEEAYDDPTIYSTSELLKDHSLFTGENKPDGMSPLVTQERVSELEAEVQRLRDQLSKAKGVNDSMWEAVVHRVLADNKNAENVEMA